MKMSIAYRWRIAMIPLFQKMRGETYQAVEKQEAMLETVYLEEAPSYVQEKSPVLTSRKIPFEITCDSTEVSKQGNTFIVTAPNASVTLSFEGMPNCETYFR